MNNWIKFSTSTSVVLNIIRFISAQIVLFGHSISYFKIFYNLQPPNAPYMQNIAVLLFFILSGLLITFSIFTKMENSDYNFEVFLVERFSRIYSALIPALLFIFIIDYINIHFLKDKYIYYDAYNIKTFLSNTLMLQDYPFMNEINNYFNSSFHLTSFGSGRPLWTLAIEWWIYICFGWIILKFFKNNKIKSMDVACFVLFCGVPLYNLIGGRGNGLTMFWLLGVVIYLLLNMDFFKELVPIKSFIVSIIFLFQSILLVNKTMIEYDTLFACLLAAFLLFLINATQKIKFHFNEKFVSLVRFLANYSFTLYLIHYSIIDLVFNANLNISPYVQVVILIALCNILSFSLAYFTEMRHKQLSIYIKRILGMNIIPQNIDFSNS